MFKKVITLMALLGLFWVSAQAETVIYAGAQMPIKDGEVGGGTMLAFGQEISDKVIVWGTADMFKTEKGIQVDNGFIGFTVFTEEIIHSLRSGLFLTVEGGMGKVENSKVKFANLANAGFYFDLSKTTKLWLGGGYSDTDNLGVYSVETGLSVNVDWK